MRSVCAGKVGVDVKLRKGDSLRSAVIAKGVVGVEDKEVKKQKENKNSRKCYKRSKKKRKLRSE